LKEIQAAADPDPVRASKDFDKALFAHIGFSIRNMVRSVFHGLTGARFASAPVDGPVQGFYRQLTRMSACLAFASDIAMLVMGSALKRRERLSARLGDVLSYLYLASSVLKRFEDQGRPPEDLPLVRWACEKALYRIQSSFAELVHNFPHRPAAWLLKIVIFPIGKPYRSPSDSLGQQIARMLLSPSPTRDRLTSGLFIPSDSRDTIGRMEAALEKVIAAETVEDKLRAAVKSGTLQAAARDILLREGIHRGVISEKESKLIHEAEALRREAIMVDDFPPDYWTPPGK
jgi:acyl-CoA dehydrogenase